ncbi:hypothetical protein JQC92_16270 [Shewanella sp. 202IG2-18]|uniref:hypothetical protein n=1 Tax=Parashewanella hymeniacidonis TaxID=2807618 RepID=UPI0019615A43|nr:hypothetical protein [Parashewanella hymeniacidonis]MBM7073571.1 hypothetical protein [Parashewanella hymeniacidonis]
MWLSVAFSPTLFGALIGVVLNFNLTGQSGELALPVCTLVGFIVGGLWAERIRKTIGLSAFLGRLIVHRDIDGAPK